MIPRYVFLLPLLSLLPACGSASDSNPANPPAQDAGAGDALPDSTAEAAIDAGSGTSFQPEAEPTGPSLFAVVDLTDPNAPVLEIRAKQLGPVFGIAFHLQFDETLVTAHDPVVPPFLGPDAPDEARYLVVARAGDVAFGGTRRGPAAGETELDASTVLTTIPLTLTGAGDSEISIKRTQVRRADGSVVPVSLAGGVLSVGGAQ